MTITSYDNQRTFSGNSSTTVFSFPPPFTANTDLVVQIQAADGSITTKVLATDYTVSATPYTAGGTVTMVVAPATGTTLIIYRDVPLTQPVNLLDGGPLPATTVNGMLDRITMWGQRLKQQVAAIGSVVTSVNGRTGIVTLTKTDVGLSSVDNTSDATKPVSAPQAAALQPVNARLTDISGMGWVSGDVVYYNGTNLARLPAGTSGQFLKTQGGGGSPPVWGTIAGGGDMLSTNNLNDVANKATSRTNLGVSIGSDVQAFNARLADISNAAWAQGDVAYFNGSNLARLPAGTSGQFLKTNGAGANPAWAAAVGSGTVTSVDMTVPTGLAVSGNPITTTGTFAITWSGIIPVAQGSTGFATYTIGDLLQANASGSLAKLAAVATGNVLISGGVGVVSAWGKIGLTTHISGTLAIANGGTNITTYTTGDILYASASNVLSKRPIGSTGDVLTVAGGVPTWASPTSAGMRAPDIWVRDEKAQNTAGGSFNSGGDRTRDLNTVKANTAGASLGSNQLTLLAGTYYIQWRAPAFQVNTHQTLLFNVTDTAVVERGSVSQSLAASGVVTDSIGEAIITIAATKVFELRHRCSTTATSTGFGTQGNFGTEVYADLQAWKVA